MSNEFKHADPGNTLTHDGFIANGAHIADGQTVGDVLYFDGINWIRKPAGSIVTGCLFNSITDVTSSRAMNTTYQNQNAFPIMIVVSSQFSVARSDDANVFGGSGVLVYCDNVDGTTTLVADKSLNAVAAGVTGGASVTENMDIVSVIPAGFYYTLTHYESGDGVVAWVSSWMEYGGTGTAV